MLSKQQMKFYKKQREHRTQNYSIYTGCKSLLFKSTLASIMLLIICLLINKLEFNILKGTAINDRLITIQKGTHLQRTEQQNNQQTQVKSAIIVQNHQSKQIKKIQNQGQSRLKDNLNIQISKKQVKNQNLFKYNQQINKRETELHFSRKQHEQRFLQDNIQMDKKQLETLAQRRKRLIKLYRQKKAQKLLENNANQKKINENPEQIVPPVKNIQQQKRTSKGQHEQINDYPLKAKQKPLNLKKKYQEANKQLLKQANIDKQSYQRAIKYIKLGQQNPSQELVTQQKNHFEQKYKLSNTTQQLPICVVIPSYNNVKNQRYKFNLKTILSQEYSNYHIVYIDDGSTDKTAEMVQDFINSKQFPKDKYIIIKNQQRAGKLYSERTAASQYCKPYQLYFLIDGDDGLVGVQVFKLFNHMYQQRNSWFIYGNYITAKYGVVGPSRILNSTLIQNNVFRSQNNKTFVVNNLKTFYNQLFLKVPDSDLMYKNTDNYFDSDTDKAIVYPMIEMMRNQTRIYYLPEIVYIFNDDTQLSISKKDQQKRAQTLQAIASIKAKDKLQCLFKDDISGSCIQPREYALNLTLNPHDK